MAKQIGPLPARMPRRLGGMPSLPRKFTSDGGAPARRRPAHAARSTSRLLAALERLYREADWVARADVDAIRYPLRYPDAADREIVGLLAACMRSEEHTSELQSHHDLV